MTPIMTPSCCKPARLQKPLHGLQPAAKHPASGTSALLRTLLAACGEDTYIEPPFFVDYGSNIRVGKAFYANHNLVILDGAPVTFGDHVFIGANCCFSTAGHPLDTAQRNAGLEYAKPITVGNNV